jgi:anti-sigma regulatory factor (Ser/Thr protein kinase)
MPTTACLTEPAAFSAWPFKSHLALRALACAVPCARLHAKQVVIEWGWAELADTAELIVSELVTNAVRACAALSSPVVEVWLASDRGCVVVGVWDGSDDMPSRRETAAQDEAGRGLVIIETLSADWGWYREHGGKVVWALLAPAGASESHPGASS